MQTLENRSLKQQQTEKAVHAVSAITQLPAHLIVGKVSQLSWYVNARHLLIHIFIEDIQLKHKSIQGIFNYANPQNVGQAYRASKRRIANNDNKFISELEKARKIILTS